MVEAQVTWSNGERFVGSASSGHAIVIDSDRQRNTAPGPMELVLIGLCACTATDVVNILHKKREAFTGVNVRAEAERATEPPTVYKSIKLIYTISGQVSQGRGGCSAAFRRKVLFGGSHAQEHGANHHAGEPG